MEAVEQQHAGHAGQQEEEVDATCAHISVLQVQETRTAGSRV